MRVELLVITPNAERLIERAARVCYQSSSKAGPGSQKKLIRKLIQSGHHSVLEHAGASFLIAEASRTLTHQLVRHRLCSYSQQSQRFVNEGNFHFVEPPCIAENPKAHAIFEKFLAHANRAYMELQRLGIKNEDARFVLANATQSVITMSANFRELRHIFCLRCSKHAQWEIGNVAVDMLRIMKREAPSVFADFVIDKETNTAHTSFPS